MKIPTGRRRLAWALGIALACGLAPAAALAQPALADLLANVTAASSAAQRSDQEAVPGQALVLYRASDSQVSLLDDSASADELAGAGFAVAQTWDFSTVCVSSSSFEQKGLRWESWTKSILCD